MAGASRPLRTKLVALLAGTALGVAGFALLEVAVRVFGIGRTQQLQRIETPEGTLFSRAADYSKLRETLGLSLDRIATAPEKPRGRFRIVVVGESTAAGFPCYPRFSFARVIEARLRRDLPGLDVEVVNFGRSADPSDTVARVAAEAAAAVAPDVLVVYSGHNDFQASYVEELLDGPWHRVVALLDRLELSQLFRRRIGPANAADAAAIVPRAPEGRRVADDAFLSTAAFARGAERFRANLERMVAAARSAGADVVLATQASNLSDFPPCFSHHSRPLAAAAREEYERELAELLALPPDQAGGEHAAELLKRLAAADPDVAVTAYAAGKFHEARGESDAARREFERALALDGYPNRAPAPLNDAIRSVAAATGATLVDVQAWMGGHSSRPAPGRDLFLDYCHPNLEGTFLLADALLPALASLLARRGADLAGFDQKRPTLATEGVDVWLERMHLSRTLLSSGPASAGRVNLLLYLHSADLPDTLRLARIAFEQSVQFDPHDAIGWSGLVIVAVFEGDASAALAVAARALAADAKSLAPLESLSKPEPKLQAALERLHLRVAGGRLERIGDGGGSGH